MLYAFVFAAGRGSRLRPYTDDTPKPLLTVDGDPLIASSLRAATDAGVDAIVVVVGYRADDVRRELGIQFSGVPLAYVEQTEREGLAHACRCGASVLGVDGSSVTTSTSGATVRERASNFPVPETHTEIDGILTLNGDNVIEGSLEPLLEAFHQPGVDGAIVLDPIDRNEAEMAGLCDVDDTGRIRSVESTTQPSDGLTGFVAAGMQIHDDAILEACSRVPRGEVGEYELVNALEWRIDAGATYVGVELDGWHLNVNTPTELARARDRFGSS